jgi:ORF6C domain
MDNKKNKDVLESQLLNSFQKELKNTKNVVSMFPSQSIVGDGNTQIANQQQVNQAIDGNNNTQIAGNVYITNHLNTSKPPPEYISEKQALTLSQLVNLIADTNRSSRSYSSVWCQFKSDFNITEYKCLPCEQYDKAINYLKHLIGS